MSDKRFDYKDINFCKDNETGKEYDLTNPNEMLELLNNFDKENKKLKIANEMMSADFVMTERELNEKIETLEKEIVKLNNGWEYLLEENQILEKFFLYNCKSRDFIDWVKNSEEERDCKRME